MKFKTEIKEKEDNSEMNSWFLLQLIVLTMQQRKEMEQESDRGSCYRNQGGKTV